MGREMGLGGIGESCFKRKFRWLMTIDGVAGDPGTGINILPPVKSARPNVAFKEMAVEHLTETLYYPSKPDYKPITVTLYDIVSAGKHPVLKWVNQCYNAQEGPWRLAAQGFIRDIRLALFDGCGNTIESWIFENSWPQQIDFGDLDMASSEVLTCDLTIRYARAYISH